MIENKENKLLIIAIKPVPALIAPIQNENKAKQKAAEMGEMRYIISGIWTNA
jgi:hypothetical protein